MEQFKVLSSFRKFMEYTQSVVCNKKTDTKKQTAFLRRYPRPEKLVFPVKYTVYSVQYTVYSVQCTVYSVQCTVYSVHR